MNYIEEYKRWCNEDIFDNKTKSELLEIKNNEKEIEDRFYKELEFGTAGLRGVIGAGTNRINIYTVGKTTQGLANLIKKLNAENRGVAISYDSRNMSPEFSQEAALILNANGIKTYIFDSLRPVPELSFAVRNLNCIAGIMITASHNLPKYNGYKLYWEDGAQIVYPKDKEIKEEIDAIDDYRKIKKITKEEAINKGLYNVIGSEIDNKYMDCLAKLVINQDIIKSEQKNIKIVYTPLNGTGYIPVKTILEKLGFENLYYVEEQKLPDGNFPTVEYPNPEDKKAFKLALDLAKKVDADIVLATDPDADRLGIYAKDSKTGKYMEFTGNMSALLIAEYELSERKNKGILPKNGVMVDSIVSSNLANRIATEYGIKLVQVLTGFKYIGEKIKEYEKTKQYEYVFGFEESYGCLIGTHARDKDAIVAVMALCEAAAYYKSKNMTLWDQMLEIYKKYGYYKEDLVSITMDGSEGITKMNEIIQKIRNSKLSKIGKYNVQVIRDYKEEKILDLKENREYKTDLPNSNVLYYELEDDYWCTIRPSGTEPKIKIYAGVRCNSLEEANNELENLIKELKILIGCKV